MLVVDNVQAWVFRYGLMDPGMKGTGHMTKPMVRVD